MIFFRKLLQQQQGLEAEKAFVERFKNVFKVEQIGLWICGALGRMTGQPTNQPPYDQGLWQPIGFRYSVYKAGY